MNVNILIIISGLVIATVLVFSIYHTRRRQALDDMRYYGRNLQDAIGCNKACGYYYIAIEMHNLFGILFSEIGFRDAEDFQSAAVNSLSRYIAHINDAISEFSRERDALLAAQKLLTAQKLDQISNDDRNRIIELSRAIEKSHEEARCLEFDLAYLKEPHVFPIGNKALFHRIVFIFRGDGYGLKLKRFVLKQSAQAQ